jgi:hypothetical protein
MVALWGRKLEDPSRLFLQRYETRSLYGASSRGIPVKNIARPRFFLGKSTRKNINFKKICDNVPSTYLPVPTGTPGYILTYLTLTSTSGILYEKKVV